MRRTLALLFAAACILRASPARGEPNDVNLFYLGPPAPGVWQTLYASSITASEADQYAADSRQRFALLSMQVGLGMSSMLLEPANTLGHSGFEFGLDFAYVPVTSPSIGAVPAAAPGDPSFQTGIWPVSGASPSALLLPAFHVRKALPFSFEIGARAIYFTESTMVATQVELKWAVSEGFRYVPDIALRGAVTYLFGIPQWDLSTAEAGLIIGKRFGVGGVMSLTPYGAVRVTWLSAKSESMDYRLASTAPGAPPLDTVAAFPRLSERFLRFTLGLRMMVGVVTLSAEATFDPGKTVTGSSAADDYPTFEVPSSITGSANLGFGF